MFIGNYLSCRYIYGCTKSLIKDSVGNTICPGLVACITHINKVVLFLACKRMCGELGEKRKEGNSASEITWSGTCIPEEGSCLLVLGSWAMECVTPHMVVFDLPASRRQTLITMQACLSSMDLFLHHVFSQCHHQWHHKEHRRDDDCPTDAMKCKPERAGTMQARKQQTRSQGEQTKNRRDDDDALEDQQRTPPRRPTSRRWGSCSPAARRRRAGVGAGWSRLPLRSAPPPQRPRQPARGTR